MAHHEERVEPEGRVKHDLALGRAQHRRQPPALARVHEQEHDVVLVDELLERRDVLLHLLDRRRRDRVPGHRDAEVVSGRVLQQSVNGTRNSSRGGRTTPGKIFLSFSAAHAALGFPPSRQSSKSNSGWRTGFENDTRAESTNVIVRTPHPCEELVSGVTEDTEHVP